MGSALQTSLDPVRRRQLRNRKVAGACWGLLAASAVLLVMATIRMFTLNIGTSWEWNIWQGLAVCVIGPAIGYALAHFWTRDYHAAARAVDSHYNLKDRATSALDFLSRPSANGVHHLAVDDALSHMKEVDSRDVVPLRAPRSLAYAAATIIAATVLFLLTSQPEEVTARSTDPLAVVVAAADRMAEEIKPLEEFAQEEQDPEITELVKEMKKVLDSMKEPEVDVREAMAKLSEIESALQQQQAKYNLESIDANLSALGKALALAEPLADAGKALSSGELEKAAEQLDQLAAPDLDRKTEKAVKEKLAELAKQMQAAGQGKLSEATESMSKGLGSDDKGRFKEGTSKLGEESRKQAKRKKLSDLLKKQCQACSECKGECESECNGEGQCKGGGKDGKNGGKGTGKSDKPSTNWGTGASGNELGGQTSKLGTNSELKLTGKQSEEGESETESSVSPEGEEEARRSYRQSYDKYRKISEAVLESEPIPLGHRQTIRRYFEAIRPQEGGDSGTKVSAPDAGSAK